MQPTTKQQCEKKMTETHANTLVSQSQRAWIKVTFRLGYMELLFSLQ